MSNPDHREQIAPDRLTVVLREALNKLPPRPWTVWTSCSFRRIGGATGSDGDVLSAYNQRSDGHPDLTMPEEQLRALVDVIHAADSILALRGEGEPVAWRWRRTGDDQWSFFARGEYPPLTPPPGYEVEPLYAAPPASQALADPVAEAGSMPGTGGFTMAVFKASDVPVGTKVYIVPPAPAEAQARVENDHG